MADECDKAAEQWVWILCRVRPPGYRLVIAGTRNRTDKEGDHWRDDQERDLPSNVVVHAWMPLPEVCHDE